MEQWIGRLLFVSQYASFSEAGVWLRERGRYNYEIKVKTRDNLMVKHPIFMSVLVEYES